MEFLLCASIEKQNKTKQGTKPQQFCWKQMKNGMTLKSWAPFLSSIGFWKTQQQNIPNPYLHGLSKMTISLKRPTVRDSAITTTGRETVSLSSEASPVLPIPNSVWVILCCHYPRSWIWMDFLCELNWQGRTGMLTSC